MRIARRVGVFGTAAICFAIYYITDIWGGRTETVSYGMLCAMLIFALAMALAFSRRRTPRSELEDRHAFGWQHMLRAYARPIAFLAILCLYAYLQEPLGYTVATAFALACLFWLVDVRSPKLLFVLSGVLAVVGYLLFAQLMGVPLPRGPLAI